MSRDVTTDLRVMLISGSLPPEACGVGDYTAQLAQSLSRSGLQVKVHPVTSYREVASTVRLARRWKAHIVHVQYPSIGYGMSLWPHVLMALVRPSVRMVLTLHEFSSAHPARRVAAAVLAALAHQVIFTDASDAASFPVKRLLARASSIVPIGSNLPVAPPVERESGRVVYFGLLRPHRGLETFLELAAASGRAGERFAFEVVGAVDKRVRAYAARLRESNPDVRWSVGLPPGEAAARLASAEAAYLPYPDGATERRGSLLAVLSNRVPTVTTLGVHTPPTLAGAVLFAQDAKHALDLLRSMDVGTAQKMLQRAEEYLARHSWEAVAEQHVRLYENAQRDPVHVRRGT